MYIFLLTNLLACVISYAIGNPCLLADATSFNAKESRYNFHLGLYAPYQCRYRMYAPEESRTCAAERGLHSIVFHGERRLDTITNKLIKSIYPYITIKMLCSHFIPHPFPPLGDSMSRDLFSVALNQFGVSQVRCHCHS